MRTTYFCRFFSYFQYFCSSLINLFLAKWPILIISLRFAVYIYALWRIQSSQYSKTSSLSECRCLLHDHETRLWIDSTASLFCRCRIHDWSLVAGSSWIGVLFLLSTWVHEVLTNPCIPHEVLVMPWSSPQSFNFGASTIMRLKNGFSY